MLGLEMMQGYRRMDNDTEKCLRVRLADDLDLTLVGFVRGRRMNV